MYTFYTDKSEDFKCKIGAEGTDINNIQARLLFENDNANLLFEGKINSEGECIVPVKKLKGLLNEGSTGNLKLEVIADDTFFSPWDGQFEVKTNKKVTVEVQESNTPVIKEQKITVQVDTPKTKKSHSEVISELLKLKGIDRTNINENIDVAAPLIDRYIAKFKIKQPTNTILKEIIEKLK